MITRQSPVRASVFHVPVNAHGCENTRSAHKQRMELEPRVCTTRLNHNPGTSLDIGLGGLCVLSMVPRAVWHLEGVGTVDSLMTDVHSDVGKGKDKHSH